METRLICCPAGLIEDSRLFHDFRYDLWPVACGQAHEVIRGYTLPSTKRALCQKAVDDEMAEGIALCSRSDIVCRLAATPMPKPRPSVRQQAQ